MNTNMMDQDYVDDCIRWASEYEKHLKIFAKDLELKLDKSSKLFISLDFTDIFRQYFPTIDMFKGKIYESDDIIREKHLREYLARCGLIYFDLIYDRPIVILPPYYAEYLDFLKIRAQNLQKFSSDYYKNDAKEYISNIFEDLGDLNNSLDIEKMIKALNRLNYFAPDLAFLYSPCFLTGIEGCTELFQERSTFIPKDIDKSRFLDIIKEVHEKDNHQLRETFDNLRPKRILPNKRDAKAIQYIEEINNKLDKNELLILISSAPVFGEHKITRTKLLDGTEYPLIRDVSTFYVAMIELCNFLAYEKINISKVSNNNINIDALLSHVESDLEIIKDFLDIQATLSTISGDCKLDVEIQIISYTKYDANSKLSELRKLFEIREKNDLMILIRRFNTPTDNLNKFMRSNGFDGADIDDIIESIITIRNLIGRDDFEEIIYKKLSELESERRYLEKFIKISLGDIQIQGHPLERLVGYFGPDIVDVLISRDLSTLKSIFVTKFENKGASYPKNAKLKFINYGIWALFDSETEDNPFIYFIEIDKDDKDGKYSLYELDLQFVFNSLTSIKQELDRAGKNAADFKTASIIKTVRRKVIRLYEEINYNKKIYIKILYDQITNGN